MVVGYAAFASRLNTKGSSNISSNWDIEITGIRGGNHAGEDAYDISEPTYTPTTATFNTGLVTIANLSCGHNDAISCMASVDKKNSRR